MIKKRTIVLFAIIPSILGYAFAYNYQQGNTLSSTQVTYITNTIPVSDEIVLASQGDIFTLGTGTISHVTQKKKLSEPQVYGTLFLAVNNNKNYSSIVEVNQSGAIVKDLQSGNSDTIDTMTWYTDPAVSTLNKSVAFVSDRDRIKTNIPDNALFEQNLLTGNVSLIASPDPYSGGITHPIWHPSEPNIILYDYYQYDAQTLIPYSAIVEYDTQNHKTTSLTTENQNAYQASFSPDGKKIMFLSRSSDLSNVTLLIADFINDSISNVHSLGTGIFAYPMFSFTQNQIYFLEANGNSPYSLYHATVQNNTLKNMTPITIGSGISANSSYSVINVKNK